MSSPGTLICHSILVGNHCSYSAHHFEQATCIIRLLQFIFVVIVPFLEMAFFKLLIPPEKYQVKIPHIQTRIGQFNILLELHQLHACAHLVVNFPTSYLLLLVSGIAGQ